MDPYLAEIIRLNLIWTIPAKKNHAIPYISCPLEPILTHTDDSPRERTSIAEKTSGVLAPDLDDRLPTHADATEEASTTGLLGYWRKAERTLVQYNLEARGIQRVLPEHRHTTERLGFVQVCLLWISINLAANNITLGMLGPAVFYLSFRDSALCAVFGALVGSIPVAYVATFGPRSGNRTMVRNSRT